MVAFVWQLYVCSLPIYGCFLLFCGPLLLHTVVVVVVLVGSSSTSFSGECRCPLLSGLY